MDFSLVFFLPGPLSTTKVKGFGKFQIQILGNNLARMTLANNIENKIFHFEKNFVNLINESDLCITRAGATSLAEISIMNKPFIAIPLP